MSAGGKKEGRVRVCLSLSSCVRAIVRIFAPVRTLSVFSERWIEMLRLFKEIKPQINSARSLSVSLLCCDLCSLIVWCPVHRFALSSHTILYYIILIHYMLFVADHISKYYIKSSIPYSQNFVWWTGTEEKYWQLIRQ